MQCSGIPIYFTKQFVILHELVYAFSIFVQYHELFRKNVSEFQLHFFSFLTVYVKLIIWVVLFFLITLYLGLVLGISRIISRTFIYCHKVVVLINLIRTPVKSERLLTFSHFYSMYVSILFKLSVTSHVLKRF